ncbi:GNAT family N-acetyltransferase [Bacillus sp. CGMCC 1.16607]|uniref:GNAT family N-acetyltransferase n=1 Tax=Bacillus sp. CGMCC 1.16607 TaxID=3351842 RepID=UPI00362AE7F0
MQKNIINITLREIQIPEDYEKLAELFNLIEPGSATAQSLEDEDQHIPAKSYLSKNEEGLLIGFGRTRVIAESSNGQIIGYGSSWRAPWVEPGQLASIFCVHPGFRKQGVGELILTHLEKWAIGHQESVLLSEIKDWIDDSLSFVQKRGFALDAHIFELVLDLKKFDLNSLSKTLDNLIESDIQFLTLADVPKEESEQKLYQLCVETSKDNPGQVGNLPPFSQWRMEFLPEDCSRDEWVFLAMDGKSIIGVTTLFQTEKTGVLYTNYMGVSRKYRGRGIARALKLLSIHAAMKSGAHTMTTDSEENNAPMQFINRSLGYVQGLGHYRILKQITPLI